MKEKETSKRILPSFNINSPVKDSPKGLKMTENLVKNKLHLLAINTLISHQQKVHVKLRLALF